jgi:hypothetical protein
MVYGYDFVESLGLDSGAGSWTVGLFPGVPELVPLNVIYSSRHLQCPCLLAHFTAFLPSLSARPSSTGAVPLKSVRVSW